jgi:hypothetical protein
VLDTRYCHHAVTIHQFGGGHPNTESCGRLLMEAGSGTLLITP